MIRVFGESVTYKIATNLPAMRIQEELRKTRISLDNSIARMSTGSKLNKSSDNPFDFSTSERIRGRLRGLQQSRSNASQAISLLQVAESSFSEIQNIMIRMKELALAAANEMPNNLGQSFLNQEFLSLRDELIRIGDSTSYNDIDLLNNLDKEISFQININELDTSKINLDMKKLNISNKFESLNKFSLEKPEQAKLFISSITDVFNDVLTQRAFIGTMVNRLESTIKNLGFSVENLTETQAKIGDVDMAYESAEYAKQNILLRAGVSVLSQSKDLSDFALKLLEK